MRCKTVFWYLSGRYKKGCIVDTTLLVPQSSRQPFGFLKSQYILKKVDDRVEVYVFQGVPQHYACPHCFVKDTIQILQYQRIESGYFKCPGCKTLFVMTHPTGLVSLMGYIF